MSQQSLEDEPSDIHVKRPFITKTIKQLDRHQHDLNRKMRKKQLKATAHKDEQINSYYQTSSQSEEKVLSKLPQVVRNGNRIVAEWKNDEIHGVAQIFYRNGIYFKGHYLNGIKVRGHFKFKTGFQYIGSCFGSKFAGKGTLIFPNGKTIEGDWKNFEVIGNGKITYPKGEVYYGQIKDFKKHGKGYFYFTDGSKYEGEFTDGLITGKGSYFVEGKLASAGKWFNGELLQEETTDNQKTPFHQTMDRTLSKNEEKTRSMIDEREKKTVVSISKVKSSKALIETRSTKKVHFN